MDVTSACDFFVVPTVTFKLLYVFVVLSHSRRRIVHINVTDHPTAAWTARQMLEAFPYDAPRLLLRDRDSIYGWEFAQMVKALKIREIRSACFASTLSTTTSRVLISRSIGTRPCHAKSR